MAFRFERPFFCAQHQYFFRSDEGCGQIPHIEGALPHFIVVISLQHIFNILNMSILYDFVFFGMDLLSIAVEFIF